MKIKKNKFTLIEVVMTLILMGILTGLAIPKMSGFKDNTNVRATNLDLEILDMAVKLYIASVGDRTYPIKDLNNDNVINSNDLYYNNTQIPEELKSALLDKKQDSGSKIYQLDMNKLKPYLNGFKNKDKEFLYSIETNTVINPLGETDGNGIQHFFVEY